MKTLGKVLVLGATGIQGGAVINFLHQQNVPIKALLLPNEDTMPFVRRGIEVAVGSFADRESLAKALSGVEHCSLVFPLLYDWELITQYAENFIAAAKQSSLKSIVFNTSLPIFERSIGVTANDIKLRFLHRFREENLPIITITPSFYLDNLTAPWSLPLIQEQGLIAYPLPDDGEFAWLSHFNLAQYTYHALLHPELIGKIFEIGGELLTGSAIAERVTKALGKEVRYVYTQPDDFAKQLEPQYGQSVAGEIGQVYQFVKKYYHLFARFYRPEEAKTVFGFSLQTFDEWVQTINWKG
ncbi:MAG: NmrA family NAD(P)-binding protein [Candidatus Kapaibacteriota bacterium]|jgi:NAD(P)H dehydrogenase (quinone)